MRRYENARKPCGAGVSWHPRADSRIVAKTELVPPIRDGDGSTTPFVGLRGEILCSPHESIPLGGVRHSQQWRGLLGALRPACDRVIDNGRMVMPLAYADGVSGSELLVSSCQRYRQIIPLAFQEQPDTTPPFVTPTTFSVNPLTVTLTGIAPMAPPAPLALQLTVGMVEKGIGKVTAVDP